MLSWTKKLNILLTASVRLHAHAVCTFKCMFIWDCKRAGENERWPVSTYAWKYVWNIQWEMRTGVCMCVFLRECVCVRAHVGVILPLSQYTNCVSLQKVLGWRTSQQDLHRRSCRGQNLQTEKNIYIYCWFYLRNPTWKNDSFSSVCKSAIHD